MTLGAAPALPLAAGAEAAPRAVFNVTRSLTGKLWAARPFEERIALAIAEDQDLPELVGRVLAARGVTIEGAAAFLDPTLRTALPDPSTLADMDHAAARIADAIVAGESIAVLADYDVDGAASAALVVRYLRALGQDARVHVPDRIREGYGPSREALAALADAGAGLIVTVDCGIAAGDIFEEIAGRADIVVLDHHQAGEELPRVAAVVNPNRRDDVSGLGHLAAAGVVFLTLVAVNRELRRRGFFAERPEPDLLALVPFVALATVCDVVPLIGVNRAFIVQGLKLMQGRTNPGLVALADAARLSGPPSVHHLGFMLGPRINAGGRIGRSELGYRLLSSDEPWEAEAIAAELDGLNTERQAIEAAACEAASAKVEARIAAGDPCTVIVVADPGWHPGVVGLIASRLVERFARPAIAIALAADGIGRGSARSVSGIDIGTAVRASVEAGIAARGGGHAMAAGLTVEGMRVGALQAFLSDLLGDAMRARAGAETLWIDGPLSAGGAIDALMTAIDRSGPFGHGHPAPRFAFAAHRIAHAAIVGQGHVRVGLASSDGARLDAIAFRAAGSPLGDALLARGQPTLHVAGRLKRDNWQGRETIRLMIDDAALPR